MTDTGAKLEGRRVLVIEDSPVVAPYVADLLTDLGCTVVGPAPTMAAARELVDARGFDAAVMDVHIRGERVFPLCDTLDAAGIPFVLTSGYANWQLPERWAGRPRLQKPFTLEGLCKALARALSLNPSVGERPLA